MTDYEINQHRFFLLPGKIREHVWKRQKRLAQERLDPYSAELVQKTARLFIQAATEALSSREGLPAVCLDLGVVEDVGYITGNTEAKVTLMNLCSDVIGGQKTRSVTEKKLHTLVQATITGEVENGHSVLTGIRLRADDAGEFWECDSKFSHLRRPCSLQKPTSLRNSLRFPLISYSSKPKLPKIYAKSSQRPSFARHHQSS
jgi:hypothetical protein